VPQTLVPPGRLGALLREQRDRRSWSVAELAKRSERFDATALDRIERGGLLLEDVDVEAALDLYDLDLSDGTYGRSELVIDLNRGAIGVGETRLNFEGTTADMVLQRYVSLLYLLREVPPGRELPLRDNAVANDGFCKPVCSSEHRSPARS